MDEAYEALQKEIDTLKGINQSLIDLNKICMKHEKESLDRVRELEEEINRLRKAFLDAMETVSDEDVFDRKDEETIRIYNNLVGK